MLLSHGLVTMTTKPAVSVDFLHADIRYIAWQGFNVVTGVKRPLERLGHTRQSRMTIHLYNDTVQLDVHVT